MFQVCTAFVVNNVFPKVLNRSITAGIIIIVILVVRTLLRKAPRVFSYALWGIVLFRLLCPISFSSSISLFNVTKTSMNSSGEMQYFPANTETVARPRIQNTGEPVRIQVPTGQDVSRKENPLLMIAAFVWMAGVVLLVGMNLVAYIRLRKKVDGSMRLYGNVFLSDEIGTPFCLGIRRPKIYLPSSIREEEREYIILHEQHHIDRGDQLLKLLACMGLCFYWFNPLIWIAFVLAGKDMEMSCDEAVMRRMEKDIRAAYSATLLSLATGKRIFMASPLAFGEGDPGQRIRNIMNYQKPKMRILIVAGLVCVTATACLVSNPQKKTESETRIETEAVAETEYTETVYPEEENPDIQKELELWAKAFVNRDGNAVAESVSNDVKKDLEKRELLTGREGNYSFGWSSPWPVDESSDYVISKISDSGATIFYYAFSSEPHLICWKEELQFEQVEGKFQIIGESLKEYDDIRTASEYTEAYSESINDSRMDYWNNGLGEVLNENALLSSSNAYRDLFSPETAAVRLLNLSEDTQQVLVTGKEGGDPGLVSVDISFEKDERIFTISMYQPYGEQGIWVPIDYTVDVVARFQRLPWDEVRNLPYREQVEDWTKVNCIGEIPEKEIRIYGYNDEEIQNYGVAVQMGEWVSFYDWCYASPQGILPKLYWNEEKQQLQIVTHIYTGTGASADCLHILQKDRNGNPLHYFYDLEDYSKDLEEKIDFRYHQDTGTLTFLDRKYGKELFSIRKPGESVKFVEWGWIAHFYPGETIGLEVIPGYGTNDVAFPLYDDMPIFQFDVELKEVFNPVLKRITVWGVPTESQVKEAGERALQGMGDEDKKKLTENIKVANQTMEGAYFEGKLSEILKSQEYFYGHTNAYEFAAFIEEMRKSVTDEGFRTDLQILADEVKSAVDSEEAKHAEKVFRILHDMDYHLLRYGVEDVGKYTADPSFVATYYGTLHVY